MSSTLTLGAIRPHFDRVAAFDNLPDGALIDLPTLTALACRSKASVYRDVAAGRLPKPIRVGLQSVRWRVADVRAYLNGGAA
jgi:predicted DNA-binding transcriptional regulator AlpA